MSGQEPPGPRRQVLAEIADFVVAIRRAHPVRVAIDGVDTAGKTTLADELAPLVEARGRPAVRASVDGFHRPRAERYRRGDDSPEGYYHDSYDNAARRAALLAPLGPGGDRRYRTATFDHRADAPAAAPIKAAAPDAILLFDGIFLLRPELAGDWDCRIFVDVALDEVIRRALVRDRALFGSEEVVRARYERRYLPAQRAYLMHARPLQQADIVLENTRVEWPVIVRAGL